MLLDALPHALIGEGANAAGDLADE